MKTNKPLDVISILNEHNAELGLKPIVIEPIPEPIEGIDEEGNTTYES